MVYTPLAGGRDGHHRAGSQGRHSHVAKIPANTFCDAMPGPDIAPGCIRILGEPGHHPSLPERATRCAVLIEGGGPRHNSRAEDSKTDQGVPAAW